MFSLGLQEQLGLPGWRHGDGGAICFKCNAGLESLATPGRDVPWTQPANRLDHFALLTTLQATGPLREVWSFPFLESHLIKIDWLHCMDKGVANFFIAGLFDLFIKDRTLGGTIPMRLLQLWRHMQVYYTANNVADRLGILKRSMLMTNDSPELTCSGAELRALVPFSLCIVQAWGDEIPEEKQLAKSAMTHLATCLWLFVKEQQWAGGWGPPWERGICLPWRSGGTAPDQCCKMGASTQTPPILGDGVGPYLSNPLLELQGWEFWGRPGQTSPSSRWCLHTLVHEPKCFVTVHCKGDTTKGGKVVDRSDQLCCEIFMQSKEYIHPPTNTINACMDTKQATIKFVCLCHETQGSLTLDSRLPSVDQIIPRVVGLHVLLGGPDFATLKTPKVSYIISI